MSRPPIKPSEYPRVPLITLDVSSNATGVAWFDPDGSLVAFKTIIPRHGVYPHHRIDEIVRRVLLATVMHINGEEIDRHILMEWSSGKVHSRRRRDGGAGVGLPTLGQAQGAVRQALVTKTGRKPLLVEENEWSGSIAKSKRADRIALEFPDYAAYRLAGKDPGLDAADAIGIGLWYNARAKDQELQSRLTKGR